MAKILEKKHRGRRSTRSGDDFVHPVRINRTGRMIGWYQSVTTGSRHPSHSLNEFCWLHMLDMLPGVISFKAQPDTFIIPYEPRPLRYTPDTEVVLSDGTVVYVEVKPLAKTETAEFQRFLDLVQPVFRNQGTELYVVTDAVVKHPIIWANLREIHRQRHLVPDETIALQLIERLEEVGTMTIGDLECYHDEPVFLRQTILSLILRKRLSIDLAVPLDEDAGVFIPDPNFNPFTQGAQ